MFKSKCFFFPTACLRIRIDCETTREFSTQGDVSGTTVNPQECQTVTQCPADTSNEPQVAVTTGFREEDARRGSYPSAQEVLNFIASKCFEVADPSNMEELNGYLRYLKEVREVLFREHHQGSLIITVECRSLQILDELWEDYCTGHLNEMAQKFLVTEDILREFDPICLISVRLKTTIDEEEYRACREYFLKSPGVWGRLYQLFVKYITKDVVIFQVTPLCLNLKLYIAMQCRTVRDSKFPQE